MPGTVFVRRFGRPVALVVGLLIGTITAGAATQPRSPAQEPQSPKIPGIPFRQPKDFRADRARLVLTPSRLEVDAGSVVRLSLSVLGARDVSRLPVTLRYDPEILHPSSVRLSKAWDTGPKPVLLHNSSRPGELVIGIARLASSGAGIAGTAELVRIEFRTLRPGDTEIRLERFALIGADSRAQPVDPSVASITVR